MGDASLIRTAVLAALIAAFGLVPAGRAPAAESPTAACESAPWTSRGNAKRSGRPRRLRRLATGKREGERRGKHDRREALSACERFGTDRADHYGPRRAPRRVPAIKC